MINGHPNIPHPLPLSSLALAFPSPSQHLNEFRVHHGWWHVVRLMAWYALPSLFSCILFTTPKLEQISRSLRLGIKTPSFPPPRTSGGLSLDQSEPRGSHVTRTRATVCSSGTRTKLRVFQPPLLLLLLRCYAVTSNMLLLLLLLCVLVPQGLVHAATATSATKASGGGHAAAVAAGKSRQCVARDHAAGANGPRYHRARQGCLIAGLISLFVGCQKRGRGGEGESDVTRTARVYMAIDLQGLLTMRFDLSLLRVYPIPVWCLGLSDRVGLGEDKVREV